MNKNSQIGVAMWKELEPTFDEIARQNIAPTQHAERAQLWAGFMSGAIAKMASDIGAADCKAVIAGILGVVADRATAARH